MNGAGALKRLGAYRVERPLGRGGMGEVFLAWDRRLRRHVAIKRVRRDKADAAHRARFRREARAAARLSHPALVQIFDVLATEDGDCIVMEHVEGTGLEERIARGPLELGTALGYARDIAAGLAEAHEKGLVHRDLKAANVRVTTSPPRAKVLDFGLALTLDDSTGESSDSLEIEGIAGTIYAMAPEQVLGHAVDHRCDLFALGGLLFHMLTGRPPFVGQGLEETVEHILSREPPRVRDLRPEVPAAVETLIEGLLEKSPARRTSDTRWVAVRLGRLAALAAGAEPAEPTLEPERRVGAVSTIHGEEIRAEEIRAETGSAETIATATAEDRATSARERTGKHTSVCSLAISSLVGPEGETAEIDAALRSGHDEWVRDLCARFRAHAEHRGADTLLIFQRPAEAVGYALAYHRAVDELTQDRDPKSARRGARGRPNAPRARTAVHLGEVEALPGGGHQIDAAALRTLTHLAALARARQILLTRAAFDLARYAAVAGPLADPDLRWLAHGSYFCSGLEEPLWVCEVGDAARSPLLPPAGGVTARRRSAASGDVALGWRPAAGQPVPRRPDWELLDKIGEGGFGEVWLAVDPAGEKRAFKFCFDTARVRALKREVTLLRLLKESLGHRDDIALLHSWSFEEIPFFLELEYSAGGSLVEWAERQGSLKAVPLTTRLKLVAETAEALAAAHSVEVLHKDVKPHNILVRIDDDGVPHAVLTDFGIGALSDPRRLEEAAFTVLGFSETTPEDPSSGSGTPGYLAPERLEGKPPTVRSDLYSLGVVLFQVVVGDLRRAMAPGWQREIRDGVLRSDLAAFVDGDPERRPRRALEIAERLRSLGPRREAEAARAALARAQRRRRRATWIAASAALLAFVVATFAARADRARRHAQNLARATVASHLFSRGQVSEGSLLLLEVHDPESTPTAVESLHEAFASPVPSAILRGHEAGVENAAWSPDGERVLSAAHDGTARIWTRDGEPLLVLRGHTELIWNALWSPDGGRVLTVAYDRTARLWDAASGAQIALLEGHTDQLRGGGWSPDGRRVFTASKDHTARLWDAATGETLAVLQHRDKVWDAALSPDGARLATACLDASASIWDAASGRRLAHLLGHERSVLAVAWSPDGRRVLTGSADGTARLWNAASGELRAVLEGHRSRVRDVAWSGDGERVLTVSQDHDSRVWNAETGLEIARFRGHEEGLWDGAWSGDGNRIVTNGDDRTARVWHAHTGAELAVLRGHGGSVWSASWSADGRRLLTASEDGTVRVWHLGTGQAIAVWRTGRHSLEDVAWSGDGARLLSASQDGTVRIWDVRTGEERARLEHPKRLAGAAWSPGERSVLTTLRSRGGAYIWNAAGERVTVHEERQRLPRGAFSPDGSRVATASWDGTARIWDPVDGRSLVLFEGHENRLWDVAWSPDGRRIVTASQDRTARIWDALSGETLTVLAGHDAHVQAVAWSGDGTRIATASRDRTARVWDAASGETLTVLRGHEGFLWDVAWSGDGARLLSAGWDGRAHLWDPQTGELLATYRDHTDGINAVAWSPDSRRFATVSIDGTVRFWDAANHQPTYLKARIRARNRLCLEPALYRDYLGLEPRESARRHDACRACVPAFFERLDSAPLWEWPAYVEAWEVYAACFAARAGQ